MWDTMNRPYLRDFKMSHTTPLLAHHSQHSQFPLIRRNKKPTTTPFNNKSFNTNQVSTSEMQSEESSNNEATANTPRQKQGEWLDLSLGMNPSSQATTTHDSESQSRPSSGKIFSCNFCMRKFYSSQALGGHQNAHKRERGAIRHYQSHKMMAIMAHQPFHTSPMFMRSLGVQAHSSHVHNRQGSNSNGTTVVARFTEADTRFGEGWREVEERSDLMWPGSFRLDHQQQQQQQPEQQSSSSIMLDLNLKL